jgi:RNA polymerase sigma-70 factor (ECF subfamily)
VEGVVGLLAEDAAWSMPPLATWYAGRDAIAEFLRVGPLSGRWQWRRVAARANGQVAVAAYTWSADERCFLPFALDVIAMRGNRIGEVVSFITRSGDVPEAEVVERLPDHAPETGMVEVTFERLGLPTRLDR